MTSPRWARGARLGAIGMAAIWAGCGDDAIESDEAARRAYLGLDPSIATSLQLGFDGFNAATSANIDPQRASGAATGTITVTGQVDQGASANKGMRLFVGMVDWSAGPFTVETDDGEVDVDLTYATSEVGSEQPYLNLMLRNIPTGDFTGALAGRYTLRGDLEGEVVLDLSMSGSLQAGGGGVVRAPGTTTVTGTATSGDGVYAVMVTL